MFTVAPKGRVKLRMWGFTLRFSSLTLMLTGRVAALDRVTKAVSMASFTPEKNQKGLFPAARTMKE